MKRANLDHLLKQYLSGKISEEDKIKVETWIDILQIDDSEHAELTGDEADMLFQKILDRKTNLEEIEALKKMRRWDAIKTWLMRLVAGAAIIALVSYAGWYFGSRNIRTYEYASSGTTEKFTLADESLVWLQQESYIRYYHDRQEGIRYAELQGEGLFEVAKDPLHPFIVRCGEVTVKVTGTSFHLKASAERVEIGVLTGKVQVTLPDQQVIDMAPDEKITVTQGVVTRSALSSADVVAVTAGTQYNMKLEHATLQETITRLEAKFDVHITLEKHEAASCRISADLTDKSLERSLQMLTDVLDVQYHRKEKDITVTGYGCHDK